jgi:SAM-dependent methyltransferase
LFNRTYGYILKHPATRRGYWGQWYYRARYEKVMLHLQELCRKQKRTVVELGCEKGTYAKLLEKTNCTSRYVGCDIEAKSLRLAYRGQHTSYLLCDIQQLPFMERCADIVLCSEVLEHLFSPYEVLADLSELATEAVLITFPEEKPLSLLKDRHPEHISEIDKVLATQNLESRGFTIVASSQIFTSFIPCGFLEFLRVPRNSLTQTAVRVTDAIMKRIVPSVLVPHKTMLIEARRSNKLAHG